MRFLIAQAPNSSEHWCVIDTQPKQRFKHNERLSAVVAVCDWQTEASRVAAALESLPGDPVDDEDEPF